MEYMRYKRGELNKAQEKEFDDATRSLAKGDIQLFFEDECRENPLSDRILTKKIIERARAIGLPGVTVYLYDIFQLGYSLREWLQVLEMFYRESIFVHFFRENIKLTPPYIDADFFNILLEGDIKLKSEAARRGVEKKRQTAARLGRPPGSGKSKLDDHRKEIENMLSGGVTQTFIAKKFGVAPANLCWWLKDRKIKKN